MVLPWYIGPTPEANAPVGSGARSCGVYIFCGEHKGAKMKVEILYFEGYPTYLQAEETLRGVLTEESIEARVELVAVNTDEEAQELRFPGSPPVRPTSKKSPIWGMRRPPVVATVRIRGTRRREMRPMGDAAPGRRAPTNSAA
jgi:hypothetical protein